MVKMLEMYHFSELIRPIDQQIKNFEVDNQVKVYRLDHIGTVPIGNNEYILYYLISYRVSYRRKLSKKINQFWVYLRQLFKNVIVF
jgi:hypothetical protein